MNIAGGKSAAPEFERQFLGELAEEMVTFRGAFEQLLGVLSGFKQARSNLLMKTCPAPTDCACHNRPAPTNCSCRNRSKYRIAWPCRRAVDGSGHGIH